MARPARAATKSLSNSMRVAGCRPHTTPCGTSSQTSRRPRPFIQDGLGRVEQASLRQCQATIANRRLFMPLACASATYCPPALIRAHYCPAVESLLQQAAGGAQTDPPGRSLVARSSERTSWSRSRASDPLALLQSLTGSAKAVPWYAGSTMSQDAATSGPPAATTTRLLLQGGQELLLLTYSTWDLVQ